MAEGHKQRSPGEGKAPEGFLAKGHIQHSQGHRPWDAAVPEHVWPRAIFNPFAIRRGHESTRRAGVPILRLDGQECPSYVR